MFALQLFGAMCWFLAWLTLWLFIIDKACDWTMDRQLGYPLYAFICLFSLVVIICMNVLIISPFM